MISLERRGMEGIYSCGKVGNLVVDYLLISACDSEEKKLKIEQELSGYTITGKDVLEFAKSLPVLIKKATEEEIKTALLRAVFKSLFVIADF